MFHLICETTRPRTFLVGARCTRRKTLRRSIVPTGCVEDEILWSPMEIPQRGCDVFIFHPFSYQHSIVVIQNFYDHDGFAHTAMYHKYTVRAAVIELPS